MALTLTVSPEADFGRTHLRIEGADHSSSRVEIRRRINPLDRELDRLLFVPRGERYRIATLYEGAAVGGSGVVTVFDFHARATVPYDYQAREIYSGGAVQSWSSWTA